jgi:hypothetical protein
MLWWLVILLPVGFAEFPNAILHLLTVCSEGEYEPSPLSSLTLLNKSQRSVAAQAKRDH